MHEFRLPHRLEGTGVLNVVASFTHRLQLPVLRKLFVEGFRTASAEQIAFLNSISATLQELDLQTDGSQIGQQLWSNANNDADADDSDGLLASVLAWSPQLRDLRITNCSIGLPDVRSLNGRGSAGTQPVPELKKLVLPFGQVLGPNRIQVAQGLKDFVTTRTAISDVPAGEELRPVRLEEFRLPGFNFSTPGSELAREFAAILQLTERGVRTYRHLLSK